MKPKIPIAKNKEYAKPIRAYNWCITQFFEKELTDEMIIIDYELGMPKMPSMKMTYCIWGLEKCPSSEKLHIHYYCEFVEKVSMKWLKEMFNNNTLHCEPRLGTQSQAIDYVKKDETKIFLGPHQFKWKGEPKKQGTRTDLDMMVDMIEDGHTGREILMVHRGNGLRHINMIYRALNSMRGNEDIDIQIHNERGDLDTDFDKEDKDKKLTLKGKIKKCLEVDGNTTRQNFLPASTSSD